MPNMPRIDVAIPTVEAGMPSPPENIKGRVRLFGFASVLEERGVERKRDQRFVKALVLCFSYLR
jgi:hypothetical protein